MTTPSTLGHDRWLPGSPESVPASRRLVRGVLAEAGVPEHTTDAVLLLLSEVVTNAVLHAGTELRVGVSVGAGAVRVEVEDGSSVLPSVRYYGQGASTGRGVSLVERNSARWGAEPRPEGKVVWFEVEVTDEAPEEEVLDVDWEALLEGDELDLDKVIATQRTSTEDLPADGFDVEYRGLPVSLAQASLEHGDALLREMLLLALAGEEHVGRGTALDLAPILRHLRHAREREHVTFTVHFPEGAAEAALRRLSLVEEANRMAEEGQALTPAAVPEVVACQQWLLSQVVHQCHGLDPVTWKLPDPEELQISWTGLTDEERDVLETSVEGVFVADESNHMVYVNPAGAQMLGWEQADLTGRRLTTIIPPALREAHLAGFTRHQLTGKQTVLGRPLSLQVLRKDQTLLNVELVINPIAPRGGRRRFQAHMAPSGAAPEERYTAQE